MKVKVRCKMELGYDDVKLGRHINKNEIYVIDKQRADYLKDNNAIEIIEYIDEPITEKVVEKVIEKVVEEPKKEEVKEEIIEKKNEVINKKPARKLSTRTKVAKK